MKEAMFTFGYKIKLIKNADLKEYELFEKAVFAIHRQTDDFGQWLFDGFSLNENTVHQLALDIEGLHTFIDAYFNNKYSSPSSTMMMFQKIDVIRKTAGQLIDIVTEVSKMDKVKEQAESAAEGENEYFDKDEFKKTYDKAMNMAIAQARRLTMRLLGALKSIHLVIESDLIKLILGVDIMEEYKKRCKRLPKNKDLSTEFHVHFKAVSKDDRRFLEKEKNK